LFCNHSPTSYHIQLADVCRFEQSFYVGASCLNIPELYEGCNWQVVAFGGINVEDTYLRSFKTGNIACVPTYLADACRLSHSRQGKGGFTDRLMILRRIQPDVFNKTAAVLAHLKKKKLVR
jgi:hypothetical protein